MKAPACRRTTGGSWYRPSWREMVSYAANGAYQRALIALELLAQVADVHVKRAFVGSGATLVQHGGELVASDGAARGASQHLEYVELDGGDFDGLVLAPDLAGG